MIPPRQHSRQPSAFDHGRERRSVGRWYGSFRLRVSKRRLESRGSCRYPFEILEIGEEVAVVQEEAFDGAVEDHDLDLVVVLDGRHDLPEFLDELWTQAQRGLFLPDRNGQLARDGPLLERDRRQWRQGKSGRVVQGPLGPLLADHSARAHRGACGWCGEAKRAFEAMMPMKKIDIATIEAARRG
jgi:hypothetical protein